jgi:serine/threonine protein kinase
LLQQSSKDEVWLCEDTRTCRKVITKIVSDPLQGGIEAAVLRIAGNQKHVVKLLAIYPDAGPSVLLIEHLPGDIPETLEELEKYFAGIIEVCFFYFYCWFYITSFFQGLYHLHRLGIVHYDVKPGNIMWDARRQSPILIDFGVAEFHPPGSIWRSNGVVGTRGYRAPEIEHEAPQMHNVDIWSVGVILFTLVGSYIQSA